MASGFVLGILFEKYGAWYLAASAAGLFFGLAREARGCYRRKQNIPLPLAAGMAGLLLCFLLGMQRFGAEEAFRAGELSAVPDGTRLCVRGTLSAKERKGEQYTYYLKNCTRVDGELARACNSILFYTQKDDCAIGQTLLVSGTAEYFRQAANDGGFDARAYYQSKKIDFRIKDAVVEKSAGKAGFGEYLFSLRERIRDVYATYATAEDAGVLSTMTLGDKSLLDEDIRLLYQKAGISHILAISGLHISVIGMGLYRILRKARLSFFGAGAAAFSLIFVYGVMSGFGTSTVRAVLMFALMLIARCLGRSYDTASALGLAALFLLWENPYLLWYAGFMLSFGAVLGIVAFGQAVVKIKKPYFPFAENFLVSFGIQLSTVPLTAYYFYEVPVWAMLVNFFVLPVIGALLFLGLFGGILGLFCPAAAKAVFLPCHVILVFYKKMCTLGSTLPFASVVSGKPAVGKLVFFYAAVAVLVFFLKKRKSRRGFVAAGALLLAFVLSNPARGFELDVLDVGQGDGCFLQSESGAAFFFDGGSSDVTEVGKYRILPFLKSKGVGKIDYWVVSHTDADHISGLLEALSSGYRVEHLVVSRYLPEDENSARLFALAEEAKTEIVRVDCGDALGDGKMRLVCLFPDASYESGDKNALSLVMRYEEGDFSGVFTGDITSAEEAYLLERGRIAPTDFYKAAHHGSKYSNSAEFLNALSPRLSTVSCSEKNTYGHPGAEAVAHIADSGSRIFYTMESGRVKICMKDGKICVGEYKKTGKGR